MMRVTVLEVSTPYIAASYVFPETRTEILQYRDITKITQQAPLRSTAPRVRAAIATVRLDPPWRLLKTMYSSLSALYFSSSWEFPNTKCSVNFKNHLCPRRILRNAPQCEFELGVQVIGNFHRILIKTGNTDTPYDSHVETAFAPRGKWRWLRAENRFRYPIRVKSTYHSDLDNKGVLVLCFSKN